MSKWRGGLYHSRGKGATDPARHQTPYWASGRYAGRDESHCSSTGLDVSCVTAPDSVVALRRAAAPSAMNRVARTRRLRVSHLLVVSCLARTMAERPHSPLPFPGRQTHHRPAHGPTRVDLRPPRSSTQAKRWRSAGYDAASGSPHMLWQWRVVSAQCSDCRTQVTRQTDQPGAVRG